MKASVYSWRCIAPLFLALSLHAQPAPSPAAPPLDPALGITTVRLWEGDAPGAKGSDYLDVPTLTVFAPAYFKSNGTAVIVAPGGAYLGLAANHEGRQVADWFASHGITAFILHYRLNQRYLYPVPLQDAQRAVRWVRAHAKEYFVAPNRIGMIGFSAGGHLTGMAGTSFDAGNSSAADPIDRVSSRPDFLLLGYPWLDAMQPPKPKMIPSYQTLMKLPADQVNEYTKYTPAHLVTKETPPAFLFHTTDDGTVHVTASLDFYRAMVDAGVPAELHIFAHGPHGVGFGGDDPSLNIWPELIERWLRANGWLTQDPNVAADIKAARDAQAAKR
jgi:acetyl esterase/lipase